MKKIFIMVISIFVMVACNKKNHNTFPADNPTSYKSKHVIIVVVDGPRYSETWGDTSHQFIPHMANDLLKEGVVYTSFYNDGPTYTNAGHCAITTGNYQEINNSGGELPENPSIFQYWLKQKSPEKNKAWIITSKDKLEILKNCTDTDWKDTYIPSTNCGNNGIGTGYRNDSITYDSITSILSRFHPQLVLINFKEPDAAGHTGNWNDYLRGISESDKYVYDLWNFIQKDSVYKNTTAFIVTNDHGRHLDGTADGFKSHGDTCLGCRKINFFAAGPDFKKNTIITTRRNQVDIPTTVSKILGIYLPTSKGVMMNELFLSTK